jgi:nucleotide-binding universal stress UspA family protein
MMKSNLIRHIAVALDCSPHSIASLTAAAELARRMHADLRGIFVEDINLLRMAELPCSHEIRIYNADPEKIELLQLERSLRLQAKEAQNALQRIAGELMVEHSFKVYRGLVPAEVILAAHEADLLVLGRSGRSPSCRKGLGSTARKALAEGKRPLLLMRTGFTAKEWPVLVLYDGSKGAQQALGTALDMAQPGNTLNILILGETPDEALLMERELSSTIKLPDAVIEYHHIPLHDGKTLVRYIRMADSGLLVLSDRMKLPIETLHNLINEIDYPVLLV